MKTTERQRRLMRTWRNANSSYMKDYAAKGVVVGRSKGRVQNSSHRSTSNKRDGVETLVYVIETGPYVKVGIAEDIRTRLVVFKTHCPLPVRVAFHSKPMLRPEARAIEVACHAYLIEHHLHGEWFEAGAKTAIDFIETMTQRAEFEKAPVQLRLVA